MNFSLSNLQTATNINYNSAFSLNNCRFSRLFFPLFLSSVRGLKINSNRCTFTQLNNPVLLSTDNKYAIITGQPTTYGLFEDCLFKGITSAYTFYSTGNNVDLSLIRCGISGCSQTGFAITCGYRFIILRTCFVDNAMSHVLFGCESFRYPSIQSTNHFNFTLIRTTNQLASSYYGGNKEFSFANNNITQLRAYDARCAFCFVNAPLGVKSCRFGTASDLSGRAMTGFWCYNPFYLDHFNYINITANNFMEAGKYASVVEMRDSVFIDCSFSLSPLSLESGSIRMTFLRCMFSNPELKSTTEFTFDSECSFGVIGATHQLERFNQQVCFARGSVVSTLEFTHQNTITNLIRVLLSVLLLVNV